MGIIDQQLLKSKFRGTLLGVLLGDCLGAPYEGECVDKGYKLVLRKFFDKLEGPFFKCTSKPYTDDSAMTKSVVKTLIDKNGIDQKHLAINFVKEYYNEPNRGYGANVVDVFHKLRKTKCEEPILPAQEQFNGSGSYGNGAAMRTAPIALFCYKKSLNELIELTKSAAEVTHTNKLGIDGAILQSLAIHQSLLLDPKEEFDSKKFINDLIDKMEPVEKTEDLGIKSDMPYNKQLKKILYFLDNPERAHDTGISEQLGNTVEALYSVPTAIYAFIRAHDEIKGIETNNPFRRTLEYAISLGGDTDTIASMAGAICGAYYGSEVINQNLMKHCEGMDEMNNLAIQLYDMINKTYLYKA